MGCGKARTMNNARSGIGLATVVAFGTAAKAQTKDSRFGPGRNAGREGILRTRAAIRLNSPKGGLANMVLKNCHRRRRVR